MSRLTPCTEASATSVWLCVWQSTGENTSQLWLDIQQMERIVGFEKIQNWSWIVPLPPGQVCNTSILFMKYTAVVLQSMEV